VYSVKQYFEEEPHRLRYEAEPRNENDQEGTIAHPISLSRTLFLTPLR